MEYKDFEIEETIYSFWEEDRNGFHKELNMVSWKGRKPKYDIRGWNRDHTKMTKGITLNKEELRQISEAAMKHIGEAR